MIRLALMAANGLARSGLQAMLSGTDRFAIVGVAGDLATLAALLDEEQPDVAVISAERQESEPPGELLAFASLPAVVLLDDPQPHWIVDALRAGIRAVLPSDVRREELQAAVEAAAAGLVVIHPQEAQPLLAMTTVPEPRPADPRPESLTPREIGVLRLVAAGLSNKQIAARLDISEHTVKFHIASVMAKLGAGSRTEAVTIGVRQGILLL
jgi:DNA-binding NarL/FixJ family response regulator